MQIAPTILHGLKTAGRHVPRGPLTVMVFLTVGLYEVVLLLVIASPIITSTSGGSEIGVRPNLECCVGVVEKHWRLLDCVCHAGIRNPGTIMAFDGAIEAAPRRLAPLAEANNVAIMCGLANCLSLAVSSGSKSLAPPNLDIFVAYSSHHVCTTFAGTPQHHLHGQHTSRKKSNITVQQ